MSSADEKKAINGSRAQRKRIRLDESATAKVDIEMAAAHMDLEKKLLGDLTEDKQILEKLSCNNFKKMAEDYQKKVEELSAENETLKRTIKLMTDGADAFQTSEQSDENQESIQLSANGVVFGNFLYKRKAGMKVEYVICAFILCTDVLEDVLQFGTRRRLSQLQRIGSQFHCVIANRFVERPLLVLHRIQTDYRVYDVFVDSRELHLIDAKITYLPPPPYLRIEEIEVANRDPFGEKFQKFMNMPLLQKLKPALVGSQLILGTINEDNREFIKEKLLPFFDCCKRYKFDIGCMLKDISAFIASLLQVPSIRSSVGIEFNQNYWSQKPSALPIEAILNWLHKPAAVESNKAIGKKRSLRIHLSKIENMSEMVEHLKKAFKAAQASVAPFTLHLSYFRGSISAGRMEDEKILNYLSLEELSIYRQQIQYNGDVIIERNRIKDEKGIKKGKKR